jgi:hypothetical protein
MAASKLEIRPLRLDERADWEPLWKGYQLFYKVAIPEETTRVTWARLHDPTEPMEALGAYMDGRLRGIAHYLFHRSCWTIGNYCRRNRAPSRAGPRIDRRGGRAGPAGGREPPILAHSREQRGGARALRSAGGALRLHPISQAFLM